MTESSSGRLAALDGVRGLAVAGVLAFHAGMTWMPGGFLGVSTFFTLSGFLITSLLIAEWESNGRIALGAFWGRRARRLLPAAMVCLAGILVYGWWAGPGAGRADLRADVLAAVGQVANWRFVLEERSYGDLFTEPSPVLHFWSLAIEEQAYLLLPLALLGVLSMGWLGRRRVAVALTVMALASVASLLHTSSGGDLTRAYYATDTRAAEILWGAVAAAWIGPFWRSSTGSVHRALGFVAWPAGLAMVVLWSTATTGAQWVYVWALPVYPFVSLVLIMAAVRGVGPAHLLAWSPLAALGRISYGVYLYHWPVFLWLSEARTGLQGVPLVGLQLGVSLALAIVSYHLIEWPIRRSGPISVQRVVPVMAVPIGVVVGALVLGATSMPPPAWMNVEVSAPPVAAAASRAPMAVPVPTTEPREQAVPTTVPALSPLVEPLRVLLVGDSVASSVGVGLSEWGETTGAMTVWNTGAPGCGLVRGGEVRAAGRTGPVLEGCDRWPESFADRVAEFRPDLVVVMFGAWDAADHRLEGDDTWRGPGDEVYDQVLQSEMIRAATILSHDGALVAWVKYPYITLSRYPGIDPTARHGETIPERMDALNALVIEALADIEMARTVDLAGYLESLPGGQLDPGLRPDGVHFGAEGTRIAAAWLGPELVAMAGYEMPLSAPGPDPASAASG